MSRVDQGAVVAAEHGLKRSEHWVSLEHFVRKHFGQACQFCGRGPVQVHHDKPFHDCVLAGRPELELCLENLYRLCETEDGQPANNCHEIWGHLGNFRSFNPDLANSVLKYRGTVGDQARALPYWIDLNSSRPLSYPQMSPPQQARFRADLDRLFPKDSITVWTGKGFVRNGQPVLIG